MTTAFAPVPLEEQLRRALPLLQAARRAVVLHGALDVIDAIQQAGAARVECSWARRVLSAVVTAPSLLQWQADLAVLQSDRTRALDRAIRACRRPDVRRGGWLVALEAA